MLSSIGNINHLHKRNVEQAGFAVLKSPDIPSILVETAFISNPNEEEKLRIQSYQDKMADAITVGIKRYFANNSIPTRTELAQAEWSRRARQRLALTAWAVDCLNNETAFNLPIGIVEKYYYAELGRAFICFCIIEEKS